MSAGESASVERPKSTVWMWVLGLVCLSLFGYRAFAPTLEGDLAYGIGYYFIPAGIGALIFCRVFSDARNVQWRVFGIIYASLIAGHTIGLQNQEQQARRLADNLRQTYTDVAKQFAIEPDEIQRPITLQPPSSSLDGDFGVSEVMVKTFLNDMALAQNEYLKALEDAGWMTLLDGDRLSRDAGLKDSQAIVAASEAVVREHRAKSFAIIDSIPARIQQATFSSDDVRRGAVKGAEAGQVNARRNSTAMWEYEVQIMQEVAAVIDLLAKRQGHYKFDEDQVRFEEQSDADIFNAHMTKVGELGQAQSEIRKRATTEALNNLDATR
jgi:hypothetical protein